MFLHQFFLFFLFFSLLLLQFDHVVQHLRVLFSARLVAFEVTYRFVVRRLVVGQQKVLVLGVFMARQP